MGIKEYLERRSEKDLKLSDLDLNVEKSEKKNRFGFDLEQEMEEEDIDGMMHELNERFLSKDYPSVIYALEDIAILKVLFPNRFAMEKMSNLTIDLVRGLRSSSLKLIWAYKVFFPNDYKSFKYGKYANLDQVFLDNFRRLQELYQRKGYFCNWLSVRRFFLGLVLAFSDRMKEVVFSEEDLEAVRNENEEEKKEFRNTQYYLAEIEAETRLMFLDRFDEHDVSEKDFKKMVLEWRRLLQEWRDDKRDNRIFPLRMALYLKIISADEVKITNQGIEFADKREDLKIEKKPRPERKKF